MISLIIILIEVCKREFGHGFDSGAMTGVLSVDIAILYFMDKFIF